ncbi:MAG: hypothetical protein P1U56_13500 [Saprospiraceae bacterium]|nr:hypothetical protein [Saprospiraceae bacterium]
MKYILSLICVIFFLAFIPSTYQTTDKKDYDHFLIQKSEESTQKLQTEYLFWKNKLNASPYQYPYLVKMASAKNNLFKKDGQIQHLTEATELLETANNMVHCKDASILRALAKNYISEHRFLESLEVLLAAQKIGTNLDQTNKMLFDIHMELGNYSDAEHYLIHSCGHLGEFDYLIRRSKWEDHKGNLSQAIYFMERGLKVVTLAKNKSLMQWAITNLADYYGHDGNIQKSYEFYLKALSMDPTDAYAKKGIAWIVYSHEHDTQEAIRILNHLESNYQNPDLLLFKSEIAEFDSNLDLKDKLLTQYLKVLKSTDGFGNMYNKYNILIYSEDPEKRELAHKLAKYEVWMRPTAQSYSLLAWSLFKMGNQGEAVDILIDFVKDKTFEPEPIFLMAQILNATNHSSELKNLKKELLESTYELGPVSEQVIKNI